MKKASQDYTIGRHAFEKISAVEGIRLSEDIHKDFQAFEKNSLSHKDRRQQAIARKYVR